MLLLSMVVCDAFKLFEHLDGNDVPMFIHQTFERPAS